jgi:hydroxyethylthiazole kinase
MDYAALARESLANVAAAKPLIHQITNVVVTNDSANLTLAFGALPVMAYAPQEVAEMASISQALVLNIGTLSEEEIAAMLLAGHAAGEKGIPIVLDPVGAGATRFRTESSLRLLRELPITVLRGNRGEIGALVGSGEVRGVEATGSEDPREVAATARDAFGVTVAVTGATDVIVGPDRTYLVHNGSPMLAEITGSGCMATATIGIFNAVGEDPALQTALGLATYGLAAERAAAGASGPGTFHARLFDAVADLHQVGTDGIKIEIA